MLQCAMRKALLGVVQEVGMQNLKSARVHSPMLPSSANAGCFALLLPHSPSSTLHPEWVSCRRALTMARSG